jgi:hypothetical protein
MHGVKGLTVAALSLAAPLVYGAGVSVAVSDDAVDAAYTLSPLGRHGSAEVRWLHNAGDDRDVLSAGFFVNGQRTELQGRLGLKAYWAEVNRDRGYGVALGGDAQVAVTDWLSLFGSLYLGPASTSFSDVDGYREWAAGINIKAFDNAAVTLRYGSVEVETGRYGDKTVDDGFKLGLKLRF